MADASVAVLLGYVLGALGGFLLLVACIAIIVVLCKRRRRIKKEYVDYKTGRSLDAPTAKRIVVVNPKHPGILKEYKNGYANGHVNYGVRTAPERPVPTTRAPKSVLKVSGNRPQSGARVLTKTSQPTRVATLSVPISYPPQNSASVNGSVLPSRAFKENGRPRPVSQNVIVSAQTRGFARVHGNQRDAIIQGPVYVYQAPPRMVRLPPGSQPGKQDRFIVVAEPVHERPGVKQEEKVDHPKKTVNTELNLAPGPKQGELTLVNSQNERQGPVHHNITTSEIDVRDVPTADDTSRMVSSADKINLSALYLRWSPTIARRTERNGDVHNGSDRSPESPDSFKIATNTLPMSRENGEVPSPIPTASDVNPNVTAL